MPFPGKVNLDPMPNLSTAYDLLLATATSPKTSTTTSPTEDVPTAKMDFSTTSPCPLIACLESYVNPNLPIGTSLASDAVAPALHILPAAALTKLKNLGPSRVQDMRGLGQARQIVSQIPILASPATCSKFNDALGAAVQMNREKFSALAMLPAEGKEAAKELQRCVSKMKFVGGVLGLKNANDAGLLEEGLDDLWAAAERFRVPIAMREMWPTGGELRTYQASLADSVLAPIATHIHTTHNHSPLPILHFYLSGVFDRHPNIRIILSHPGVLPALMPRIDVILAHVPKDDKPMRSFLNVWQHNVYLSTTDVLDMSTMRTLLEQIPIDRVLYASNYPIEERGRDMMEELRVSGFLTREEWERVAWKNAELLFGLKNSAGRRLSVKGGST